MKNDTEDEKDGEASDGTEPKWFLILRQLLSDDDEE